ncbi:MAG: sn-glycerol-3-phosphate ABC transporter ATP-binding protein UgpC [candidate division WOR-3 bacterium]|nr:sn-glycerol-3-phosphate ABC transporter ATP-binding protein UgpC [candidate division WOR-3 bacterium]
MAELRLENVSKVYDKNIIAVQDITFNVNDREFVVLLGPSGCGKTTILRLIAGLEEVTSGKIFIDNVCVNNISPDKRDIAMVFQNYALYPHMTVYENMAFGLKVRKLPESEIKQHVLQAAEILGLKELLNRKPRQLSGGQRQRVALGRAIVRNPKLFLFDEPLSNLDAKLRVQMRGELSRLHKTLNATIVYVTHDQIEAMTLGEKVVVINNGRIQQISDPLTLYRKPANKFVAGFIGTPPMNFIKGIIKKEENTIKFISPDITFSLNHVFEKFKDQEVIIGIRPHDFTDAAGIEFKIKVEIVEPLGEDTYIYGKLNNLIIQAKVPSARKPGSGEILILKVPEEKIYLFDAHTENALR